MIYCCWYRRLIHLKLSIIKSEIWRKYSDKFRYWHNNRKSKLRGFCWNMNAENKIYFMSPRLIWVAISLDLTGTWMCDSVQYKVWVLGWFPFRYISFQLRQESSNSLNFWQRKTEHKSKSKAVCTRRLPSQHETRKSRQREMELNQDCVSVRIVSLYRIHSTP